METKPLTAAEYRKARAILAKARYSKLEIAKSLDRYDRGVRELRQIIAADNEATR
jgi:hypothetical protein